MSEISTDQIEIVAQIYLGGLIALLPSYLLSVLANFLDDAMDYGSIFWKLRAYKAKQAVIKMNGDVAMLEDCFEAAYDEDDNATQAQIVAGTYEQIASKYFPFKRWICKVCMGVYFSIYLSVGGGIALYLFGFSFVTYFFYMISAPILTYRFI